MNGWTKHRPRWSRLLAGAALGLSLAWSCGGPGQGCGCQTDCDNCQPGENLYQCAQGSSTRFCAIDDFTADQHCAAIGSYVAGQFQCPGGSAMGETRAADDPSSGSEPPAADNTGASSNGPPRGDATGASDGPTTPADDTAATGAASPSATATGAPTAHTGTAG